MTASRRVVSATVAAASLLLFAGFALAAGSLVVQLLEVGPVASERAVVRAGLPKALAGSIVSFSTVHRRNGRFDLDISAHLDLVTAGPAS
jgi:hypothetical protein